MLYKYPQARVSLPAAGRREPRAATAAGPSSSCSTPASSTRTATSTSSSNTRRRSRRTSASGSRSFNRGPDDAADPRPAAPVVSQHLGLGRGSARREPLITAGAGGRGFRHACWPTTATPTASTTCRSPTGWAAASLRRGGRRSAVHRQRDPTPRACTARVARRPRYVKDAFHRHVIHGEAASTRQQRGTKACLHYRASCRRAVHGHASAPDARQPGGRRCDEVDAIVAKRAAPRPTSSTRRSIREGATRRREADPAPGLRRHDVVEAELPLRRRQLARRATTRDMPPPESRKNIRNQHWRHLNSMRVLSMPDKWEYPWFAAWDLAFHTRGARAGRRRVRQGAAVADAVRAVPASRTGRSRPTSGSSPTSTRRCMPGRSGASTTWTASARARPTASSWRSCFHKLLINFAWWINKVDSSGNNVFEGGFLGLDNITVIDRCEKLPGGAVLEQSRRHRLDGHVLPEPDAHRAGTGPGEPAPTRGWPPSSSSTTSTSAPP